MRENKFRVWDKQDKVMKSPRTIEQLCWIDISSVVTEDYIFDQFTGLTDKNGVEIFEGDIILCGNGKNAEIKHGEFSFNCDCIEGEEIDAIGFYFSPEVEPFCSPYLGGSFKGYEIIGNIHEHPELIKEI